MTSLELQQKLLKSTIYHKIKNIFVGNEHLYNKPRIISTYEETKEYMCLPRGLEEDVKSFLKEYDVKELVRDYGMAIVDECHHISTFSFQNLIRINKNQAEIKME